MSTQRELHAETPLGTLCIVADADSILGLYLPEHRTAAPAIGVPAAPRPARPSELMLAARAQLFEYFDGTRRTFDLPLAPVGTDFQREVWAALCAIPYGQTISYQELATRIGRPTSSRAVGAANGKNPLSIFVPCHRVVGADGKLTGYAGGVNAKAWLLAHERNVLQGGDAESSRSLASPRMAAASAC